LSTSQEHITPKKRTLVPWITAILMVVGVSVIAAIYWNKLVRVNEIEVRGTFFTTPEEVIEMAAIPMGVKPDSLDLETVVNRIESLDYVKSVIPYIEPNGDLDLKISERWPIALLVNGPDEIYVDRDGVRLPILPGKIRDLPLVYGFSAIQHSDTLKGKKFEQIRDFLLAAKANKFGWSTISEVAFTKEEGVVALSHENGVKMIFGYNDFPIKLQNWEVFYGEVIATKGIQKMQQVDLRFTNQIVTREQ
tara:strand:- start:24364 stop:25110 length:747 start_codon:yes stop_codon:yes gene_type:complete